MGCSHCVVSLLSQLLYHQVIRGCLYEYMSQPKRIHTLLLAKSVQSCKQVFKIPFFFLHLGVKLKRYRLPSLRHPSHGHVQSTEAVSCSQCQLFPANAYHCLCSPSPELAERRGNKTVCGQQPPQVGRSGAFLWLSKQDLCSGCPSWRPFLAYVHYISRRTCSVF